MIRSPSTAEDHRLWEKSCPTAASSGFTLVELLVVIGVVGVLAALLLPSLTAARQKARGAQCLQQVHQLAVALRMYADDHGGLLPEDPPFIQANPWIPLLRPFVGSSTNLFRCPVDDFGEARVAAGRSSYVLNEYTASGNGDSQPYPIFGPNGEPIPAHEFSQRIDGFLRPSDTFLAFEVSNVGNDGPGALWHDDHTHPVTWGFGWQHVLADINPTRHGRSAHYMYADGHAAGTGAAELQRRIEQGDNFSLIAR